MPLIISPQWEPKEWELMVQQLQKLTLEELRQITTTVGINFSAGNETITDKNELILVLDEADKNELYAAYQKVAQKKD